MTANICNCNHTCNAVSLARTNKARAPARTTSGPREPQPKAAAKSIALGTTVTSSMARTTYPTTKVAKSNRGLCPGGGKSWNCAAAAHKPEDEIAAATTAKAAASCIGAAGAVSLSPGSESCCQAEAARGPSSAGVASSAAEDADALDAVVAAVDAAATSAGVAAAEAAITGNNSERAPLPRKNGIAKKTMMPAILAQRNVTMQRSERSGFPCKPKMFHKSSSKSTTGSSPRGASPPLLPPATATVPPIEVGTTGALGGVPPAPDNGCGAAALAPAPAKPGEAGRTLSCAPPALLLLPLGDAGCGGGSAAEALDAGGGGKELAPGLPKSPS
mmetsp:Transcript_136030/g.344427  ORF Transcript_136030/g.344427 Transcript_136030/m.344427 type:complete len:331 (-) Transcript_136030:982-1974(-)